jgi:hypothetical protein
VNSGAQLAAPLLAILYNLPQPQVWRWLAAAACWLVQYLRKLSDADHRCRNREYHVNNLGVPPVAPEPTTGASPWHYSTKARPETCAILIVNMVDIGGVFILQRAPANTNSTCLSRRIPRSISSTPAR